MPDVNKSAAGVLSFAELFEVKNGRVCEGYRDPYDRLEDLRPVPFADGWYFTDFAFIWSSGPFSDQGSAKRAALDYEKPFYLKESAAYREQEPAVAFMDAVMNIAHWLIWQQHTGAIDPGMAEETVALLRQTEDVVLERVRTCERTKVAAEAEAD